MTTDIIIPEPLRAKARELALPDSLAADLLTAYAPYAAAGGEIKTKIAATETVTPAIARDFRLAMVKVRTGSDKKRKDLKADSLLRGKAIDGLHAMIELEATAVERAMDEIEKAAERAEAVRVIKLREKRLAILRPFVSDPSMYHGLEKMESAAFAELVESSKFAHAAREQARLAAEKAEAERIEAARIAAIEAERKRQEELAAAKAEAELMRKKAADEAEARRIADEQARAERAAIEAKAATERKAAEEAATKERARVEAERAAERAKLAKIEAERKAEADRREAEEQAKRNAAEQARIMKEKADAAPDAEKIEALAQTILAIPLPVLSGARNVQHDQIVAQRGKFVAWLNSMAQKVRA